MRTDRRVTYSALEGWRISIIDLLHQIREKTPSITTQYNVRIVSRNMSLRLVGFNGHMALMYNPDLNNTREWNANRRHSGGSTRIVLGISSDIRNREIHIRIT